ncbi:hypothetical protein AB0E63_31605 [Kribbella sp. NPDC026596]|uniref:hypothetical protein n=1 Tax=Kribbella sp. NPDC026596 TaxID=3155122 RepID=UPI003404C072
MSETTMAAGLADELDMFWDGVGDDPELLRAEFDDLIAACWDDSPPAPPSRPRRPGPKPRPARPPGRTTACPDPHGPLHSLEARQRGPPR